MDCGSAKVCGVLALETGYGPRYYHHDAPTVHGLWPQVPPYGNSPCLPPASRKPRRPGLPACYNSPSINPDHQEWFVEHEWTKHGTCAGAASEDDFFAQICTLASAPLGVMANVKAAGGDLDAIAHAVSAAGFPIHSVDTSDSQLLLSACGVPGAHGTVTWKLAPVAQFDTACGFASAASTPRTPTPAPAPAAGAVVCVLNVKGPPCASNADCASLGGCLRCARSGFCTATP